MKCDELKRHHINEVMDMHNLTRGEMGYSVVYYANDVDAAIAELKTENLSLKAKNIELQSFYDLHGNVDNYIEKLKVENKLLKKHIANGDVSRITWIDEVIELKQKLESVQASMYADVVDANMKIRRLQRALYKACANWAHEKDDRYYLKYVCISDDARIQYERWRKMDRKCQAKAEEYK